MGLIGLRHVAKTTPLACAATFIGVVIVIASVAWLFADGGTVAFLGIAVGGLVEAGGMIAHDRWHLRRHEIPHAMWGLDDARRQKFMGGPRVRS